MTLDARPEDLDALAAVSDTALVTLFGRAAASRAGGLLDDPLAEALADALRPRLAASTRPIHRRLAARGVPGLAALHLGLRARYFDERALGFLQAHPGGLIVNLGCGFDTRPWRLAARLGAPARVVELDLPPVIALKRRLLTPPEGAALQAADLADPAWLDLLPEEPALLLAEGLLMYLSPEVVGAMVRGVVARAPGSELVAEVIRRRWLEGWRGRLVQRKLERNFGITARFCFGVASPDDLCALAPGIAVTGEWSFMDEADPRLRPVRWMRWFDGLRRLQWVVSWRLGEARGITSPGLAPLQE